MRSLIFSALLVVSTWAWTCRTPCSTGCCILTDPAPIPEPGTLTLMAAGALAALRLSRRKK